jgi:hypothetical protein
MRTHHLQPAAETDRTMKYLITMPCFAPASSQTTSPAQNKDQHKAKCASKRQVHNQDPAGCISNLHASLGINSPQALHKHKQRGR